MKPYYISTRCPNHILVNQLATAEKANVFESRFFFVLKNQPSFSHLVNQRENENFRNLIADRLDTQKRIPRDDFPIVKNIRGVQGTRFLWKKPSLLTYYFYLK